MKHNNVAEGGGMATFQWTEDRKRGSCQVVNEFNDAMNAPDQGQNFGNLWYWEMQWCMAQPKEVRRKYGWRY